MRRMRELEKRNSRGVKELEMQRAGEGRRLGSQFRDPFHVCFMLMVRALSNLLGQYVRISLSICQNSSYKNDFIYIYPYTYIYTHIFSLHESLWGKKNSAA